MRRLLIPIFAVALLMATSGTARANSISASGTWGNGGYSVFDFTVGSAATVDITYNGGYGDATFSLFDGADNHIITNDDQASLNPHLTQNLGAGSYSLIVSYCCGFYDYINNQTGATFSGTDGFNSGTYWVGGSGTQAGLTGYFDSNPVGLAGTTVNFTLSSTAQLTEGVTAVPEPTSLLLLGSGLAGLVARRRRKAQQASAAI